MGLIFGKITVETPKYQLLQTTPDYEIRLYGPSVVAEVTYDPAQFNGNQDGGFMLLASYIGALGNPQNSKPEKIAMTAPVITQPASCPREETEATAVPVVANEGESNAAVTMQFILPSAFAKAEEAPRPLNERVVIRDEKERKVGVVKFSGPTSEKVVKDKVEKLRESLERDGYKPTGGYLLARYNDPRTLPMFRTNEVMIPIE